MICSLKFSVWFYGNFYGNFYGIGALDPMGASEHQLISIYFRLGDSKTSTTRQPCVTKMWLWHMETVETCVSSFGPYNAIQLTGKTMLHLRSELVERILGEII